MTRLLIASSSEGKAAEMRALLAELGVQVVVPKEIGLRLEVAEDGRTYVENACKKASAFAKASGLVSLGDDSGLEVDVLDGRPGLLSHRFCPIPGATDADRRRYLLELLKEEPRPWTARFYAAVAVARPSGEVGSAEGGCEGEIIPQERGSRGFGYDPIFMLPALGRTMAELEMDEKNRLSHRARAVQNAAPLIRRMLEG